MLRFAWDESKDAANRKKHGISFDEAQTVFYDEHARLIADPDHSDKTGLSSSGIPNKVDCWLFATATGRAT